MYSNLRKIRKFFLLFFFFFSLYWCYNIMFLYNCWGFMFIVELSRWDYASWLPNLLCWHLYKWGLSGCAFNVTQFIFIWSGRSVYYWCQFFGKKSAAAERYRLRKGFVYNHLYWLLATGYWLLPLSLIIFAALGYANMSSVILSK